MANIKGITAQDLENNKEKVKKIGAKDYAVFKEEFIPNTIIHRDGEIRKVHTNLLLNNNVNITGGVGTGKTLSIRWLLKHMKAKDNKRVYIYINCRSKSIVDIWDYICVKLGMVSKKRSPIISYSDKVNDWVSKNNIEKLILCFDEIDYLVALYKDPDLLYLFADNDNMTLILISNTDEWKNNIGARTYSRLKGIHIPFPDYTDEEVRDILRQRLQICCKDYQNVISEEELISIVDILNESNTTIREGINMVSNIYDWKKIKKITVKLKKKDINQFLSQVINYGKIHYFNSLKPNLRVAIYIITDMFHSKPSKKSFTVSELTDKWNEKSKKSERITERTEMSIRNYLRYLETYQFVKKRKKPRDKAGYEYSYLPTFDIESFEKFFELNYGYE